MYKPLALIIPSYFDKILPENNNTSVLVFGFWIKNLRFKTNLVYILHNADFLASKIEYDNWKTSGGSTENKAEKTRASTGRAVNASEGLMNTVKGI